MYEYRKLTPEERKKLVEQRIARGYPAHAPPHSVRGEQFYLLTAACYEHALHMTDSARRQQLLELHFERFDDAGMEVLAWVILPNHYHLLVRVSNFGLLKRIFGSVHGKTSYQWNQEDGERGRKVWFRYSDRAIRSQAHYYTTLNYIHYNPVKHGWVQSPYDWTESSVHWYLEHQGREWLRDLWSQYPVRDYGNTWDRW
jgi:putative transposase